MKYSKFYYGEDPTGQGFFWPKSEAKRREWLEVKRLRPVEAQSVYQCNPGMRQGDIFLEDDFSWYHPPTTLSLGMQSPEVREFLQMGTQIVTGWDTALSAQSTADYTVGVTGLLVPCDHFHRGEDVALLGECDPHFDVYVLDVFRAKMDLGDSINAVRTQFTKWQPAMVVIEKRANGTPIMQALNTSGIPLEGVDPMESKRDRVVNARGVGSVQGWFRLHRVKFPSEAPWLAELIREIKDFTGEKGNADDQVDALAHMVGYAIREGGQNVRLPSGWEDPNYVGRMIEQSQQTDMMAMLSQAPNLEPDTLRDLGLVVDPFMDCCDRCKNFDAKTLMCGYHKRKVSAIHPACEMFDSSDGLTFVNWR